MMVNQRRLEGRRWSLCGQVWAGVALEQIDGIAMSGT